MTEDVHRRKTLLRRLTLAKQLYEHALDHSRNGAALDKMIAVHNFHNAIEVLLRAILLEHEIRVERSLNINFEQMLNEIDQFPKFSQKGQRLSYRQELGKLNSVRNLVQHQAHEPEGSTMEEWRVFTRRFLTRSFSEYFGEDFDSLTSLDLVSDNQLRAILSKSALWQINLDWKSALAASKLAFEYASFSIEDQLPEGTRYPWSIPGELRTGNRDVDNEIKRAVEKVYDRIGVAERFAAILGSGVNLADLARYRRTPISVLISANGTPHFQLMNGDIVPDEVSWVHTFVVSTIIRWETVGLSPAVQEWCEEGCDKFLSEPQKGESN
jgi:hypothetical protein